MITIAVADAVVIAATIVPGRPGERPIVGCVLAATNHTVHGEPEIVCWQIAADDLLDEFDCFHGVYSTSGDDPGEAFADRSRHHASRSAAWTKHDAASRTTPPHPVVE
jgi:hypothetical protein